MRGYYEADWLGTGISSNNNQSNSYVLRQRQLWAQAELNSGWAFTGGQMWSLATETKQGLTNRSEATPQTIDPNYTTGFVWARQYGFRVVKSFDNKYWVGVAAENPQTLTLGGTIPAEIGVVLGSSGNSGGVYNGGGAPGGGCTVSSLPTTCTGSGNVASYSFNLAPDMIAKIAAEPGWGHWELFGVARFFRDRIYRTPPPARSPIRTRARRRPCIASRERAPITTGRWAAALAEASVLRCLPRSSMWA